MNHSLQCTCGALKGAVTHPELVNRGVCYCKSCQAFAHYLKRETDILDDRGGTDIIQTTPKYVSIDQGIENLACMRLTKNGLLRWYTSCCSTPIGNTPPNMKISFVGLVHNCLTAETPSLDDAFGPIRMRVHTQYAKGEGDLKSVGFAVNVCRFAGKLLRARIDGSYKNNPFFVTETGAPVVNPIVLDEQARVELMRTVT